MVVVRRCFCGDRWAVSACGVGAGGTLEPLPVTCTDLLGVCTDRMIASGEFLRTQPFLYTGAGLTARFWRAKGTTMDAIRILVAAATLGLSAAAASGFATRRSPAKAAVEMRRRLSD